MILFPEFFPYLISGKPYGNHPSDGSDHGGNQNRGLPDIYHALVGIRQTVYEQ